MAESALNKQLNFGGSRYGEGSPEHDKLMIKCMSKDGLKRIRETIEEPTKKWKITDFQDKLDWSWNKSRFSERVTGKEHIVDVTDSLTYETEYIVKGHNGFILGYVDAVIDIEYTIIFNFLSKGKCIDTNNELSFHNTTILEAKPILDSIGQVMRQMKTYRDAIMDRNSNVRKNCNMRIATYSILGEDEIEFLRHEGIEVIVFEK
jgi:hypothetical protein